jgi:hypothetical protein
MTLKPKARVALPAVERSYHAWCLANGLDPLSDDEIGGQLVRVLEGQGVRGKVHNGTPKLIGVAMKAYGA